MPPVSGSSIVPSCGSVLGPFCVPACLSHMPCGPHRLIRPPRVPLLASSACLSHRLIGSPSCLVSPGSLPHRQAGRGETTIDGGRHLVMWLAADGVAACLSHGGDVGGAARRSSLLPSHRLIIPSTTGGFFSFSPDPLPPALLGLLAVACSPVPGRGMCGLRYGLRRRACGLLACVLISRSALSLLLVRLLLYAPGSSLCVVLSGALCGDLRAILAAILCRLGVFQYMPLNGIVWLLMGIFGDVVRRPFSALPAASSSSLCSAFRPLSAAVSWRWRRRFPAVSLVKRRVCVLSCSCPLSASRVMGWIASGIGCRVGRMASAGCLLAFIGSRVPCPLGRGIM